MPGLAGDFTAATVRLQRVVANSRARRFGGLRQRAVELLSDRDPDTPPLRRCIGSRGPSRWYSTRRSSPTHGLLSWGSSSPLRQSAVPASTPVGTVVPTSAWKCQPPDSFRSCRSSRLQRFPPQRPDRSRTLDSLRVCCTPQPALGFARFQVLGGLTAPSTRRSVDSPHWRTTLRSVLPPRQPSTNASPLGPPFRAAPAFTAWRSFSSLGLPASVSPRPRAPSTSRPCSAGEFQTSAQHCCCAPARCSHGLMVDTLDACRAPWRWTPDPLRSPAASFRLAVRPLQASHRPREGEGRQSLLGSVWL